ncbi:S8 family serine peptidase [Cellulomonas aerilata]|uniref:Serine protease n=1 Tax=Cellulomonas aerilata TaxID=515326 RepID=A0A512DCM4_9CELL|nr:S8 family serine peptidase [Cellulomonas aerilata]GEO34231.1 hypothetical protein CAE01nite_19560 [Cellulomonas aerilata]
MDLHRPPTGLSRVVAAVLVASTALAAAAPASAAEARTTLDVLSIVDGEHVVTTVVVRADRAESAEAALEDDPGVLAVDAQVTYQVDGTGPDPYWDEQDPVATAKARDAWTVTRGAGQVVAVLDTGVDPEHEDLAGALLPLVDVIGGDGDPSHGTGVAGVVAARADNGLGGAGIAPDATVLPIRVCNSGGCPSTNVAQGIFHAVDHGADVINLSLSGRGYSDITAAAVLYALDRGVSVVASAGNSGLEGNPVSYPAANSGVIAVGALTPQSTPAAWSVNGWQVDLSTVGESVLVPVPGNGYGNASGTSFSGPAVAASVALLRASHPGIGLEEIQAALQASSDSSAPWDRRWGAGRLDIPAALAAADRSDDGAPTLTTGQPQTVDVGWAPVPGATRYRVRVDGTVRAEVADPHATLTGLTDGTQLAVDVQADDGPRTSARLAHVGVPAPGVVTLHEGRLTGSGASTLLGLLATTDGRPGDTYSLVRNGVSVGTLALPVSSQPSWLWIGVGSWPPGAAVWRLRAVDRLGRTSAPSNGILLGEGVPQPPAAVTGLAAGLRDATVLLTWDQLPQAAEYEVEVGGDVVRTSRTGGAVVAAPPPGEQRTYSVRAVDPWGQRGPWTSVDVRTSLPGAVPDAPTSVTATRGSGSATVSWAAPADHGSPITLYTVVASPGGATVTTARTTASVGSLTNGVPYTFTVTATSAAGTSPASAPSAPVTPAGAPDAPVSVSAAVRDGSADVTWTAPASNGSPITSYTVTASPGGRSATTTGATAATVTGLTNGTAYSFTVTATNAVGTGPAAATPRPLLFRTFTDVPATAPFADDIGWLVARGITTGRPDNTFGPLEPVSREAMAAFLYRSAGSPTFAPPGRSVFVDLVPSAAFYAPIHWLAAQRITTGSPQPDGTLTYDPLQPVTRQAMAAFLYRAAGRPAFTAPATATFPDVPAGAPFRQEIEWLAATGITTGTVRADGTRAFDPLAPVTRQAMAAFLHRMDRLTAG